MIINPTNWQYRKQGDCNNTGNGVLAHPSGGLANQAHYYAILTAVVSIVFFWEQRAETGRLLKGQTRFGNSAV
jgi:hypothetical protein